MAERRQYTPDDTPKDNYSRGLLHAELPELGEPTKGKVRDSWVVQKNGHTQRIMVTTDRQSAYDRFIGTVPGKGRVLNLLSKYWFDQTQDLIPNHVIAVPHPNVLIAKQAQATLPVEIVVRRYMAKSATSTSVYDNYMNKGRRNIYGLDFPDGLQANEEFPMGTILTPTTKADTGHDEELTDESAQEMVDQKLGDGTWEQVKVAATAIFERARAHCLAKGLILVDTKYEFGIDEEGNLMLIDEVHTPDSSRFWLADTYAQKFAQSQTPDTFDKEILRRWLAEHKFKGEGPVPKVDQAIVDQMSKAYTVPYEMITGEKLPGKETSIRAAVMQYMAA